MRRALVVVLDTCGLVAFLVASWLVAPALAFAVAGATLLGLAALATPPPDDDLPPER